MSANNAAAPKLLDRDGLDRLLQALSDQGFELIGPTVRDRAIVYDRIASTADLPVGWTDQHDGGHYRLRRRADQALFGYVVGPQSWKKYLFPPEQRLFRARRVDGRLTIRPEPVDAPRRAFIGVRSCELAAMAIQDRVFTAGPFVDSAYQARRENVFLVAVNCGEPGGTCFCVSMDTGPRARSGYDLALTEVLDGAAHYFVVEAGSEPGRALLAGLPGRSAEAAELGAARAVTDAASRRMGRELDTAGIKDLLYDNLESPHWDVVAQRCLSCANCTLVCPTCFCSEVEDVTDLDGQEAERLRRWDSCYNLRFSYVVGGSVRQSTAARYRQWLTHKLAGWQDQFGSSGCVGCGRCITWCPVGIDLTEEVRAIRAAAGDAPND